MFAVRRGLGAGALAGLLLLAACSGGAAAPAPDPATRSVSVSPSQAPPTTTPSTVAAKPPATSRQAKAVVVLDPGHNGGNASHPAEINKQVPAGRGATKPCNTTGTSTSAGYAEHAFTWDVAQRVGAALAAQGVRVVYTRDSDTGVGPCVDRRAAIGNEAGAAAVVSIHADGSDSPGARGFHVSYSSPPLNAAQRTPSIALADDLRDAFGGAGFPTSNYLGANGIYPRRDLAGLNLSTRPAALVECGNMRNPAEAAAMSSAAGRQHYADAIVAAILHYLNG
ncbi:N-acetylmuramoyl-L-alanine amidase [Amycolatopsis alkalitolerans]|uniref:N-acetylmuramoyl-L-alanine amidase n=1 Tax=Amycolatopsis alkalitolerans TaxID=2547244 RepID=UPI001F337740|nr:N-acetylmuramoyl-L-alanine amidase [Amycolatopsis alkalitolerans]